MRIRELDGLRGIAVLAVISEHYMNWLPLSGSRFGWLGVDLFFILSGFLITSILLNLRTKEHYFRVFYLRRALRIFPPYYLALALYLTISAIAGKMGSLGLWMQYVLYYTSLGVGQPKELFAGHMVQFVTIGLAVLWSLSVEELYYTIWAPVVRYTSQRGFTLILLGMIVAAPVLRVWLHTATYPEIYTFYCRMDGLAYGSIVALLMRARKLGLERWLRWDKRFDMAAWVVATVTVLFWAMTHGERSNVLVSGPGLVLADVSLALFVAAVLRRAEGGAWWLRLLRAKVLRSIGMVSYSLYLFHYPMRILAAQIVRPWHLSRHLGLFTELLLGLVFSFAVAYGLWYGMESAILRWKDRKVPSTAHPA
jgi:peptidoglycan/LPS O-acetylase OafA/YrhL